METFQLSHLSSSVGISPSGLFPGSFRPKPRNYSTNPSWLPDAEMQLGSQIGGKGRNFVHEEAGFFKRRGKKTFIAQSRDLVMMSNDDLHWGWQHVCVRVCS